MMIICRFLATTIITTTTNALLSPHIIVLLSVPCCADLNIYTNSEMFLHFLLFDKRLLFKIGVSSIKCFFFASTKGKEGRKGWFKAYFSMLCTCPDCAPVFSLNFVEWGCVSMCICFPLCQCTSCFVVCSYSLQAYRACQRVLTYIVTVESWMPRRILTAVHSFGWQQIVAHSGWPTVCVESSEVCLNRNRVTVPTW